MTAAPPATKILPPKRSMSGPATGASPAPTREPTVTAADISVRLQPNSRSDSGMKTPSTGLKNATSVKVTTAAAATTVQPRKKRGLRKVTAKRALRSLCLQCKAQKLA